MSSSSALNKIFEFPPTVCPDGLTLENFEECLTQHLSEMHIKGSKQPKAAIFKQLRNQTAAKACLAGTFSTKTCDVSPFCEITGTGEGLNTVMFRAPVEGTGKWMFEAVLCTSGIMQIGWTNANCIFTEYSGVGDEPQSFGLDGKRNAFYCGEDTLEVGVNWVSGDVITSVLDIPKRAVSFYKNGTMISYTTIPSISKTIKYAPAVTLVKDERVIVNLGDAPFMYKAKDAFSTRAEPNGTIRGKVRYILKTLFKLIKTTEGITEDEKAVFGLQLLDSLMNVFTEAGMDNAAFLLLTEFLPNMGALRSSGDGAAVLTTFFDLFMGTFGNDYFKWFIKMMVKYCSICFKCFSVGKPAEKIEALEDLIFILRCAEPIMKTSEILSNNTMLEDILGLKFLTRDDLSVMFPKVTYEKGFDGVFAYLTEHGDLYKTYQTIMTKQYEIAEMLFQNKKLIPWLEYLINKNLDLNKAFIPPGLSSITTLSNAYALANYILFKHMPKPLSITVERIKKVCFNFAGFREEAERVGGAVSYLLKEHGIPDVPKDGNNNNNGTKEFWEIVDLSAHLFCLGEKRLREQGSVMKNALWNTWIGHDMESEASKEFDALVQKLSWYLDMSFRTEIEIENGSADVFMEIINVALANEDVLCFVPNAYFEVVLVPGLRKLFKMFDPKILSLIFTLAERNVLVNPDLQRALSDALLLIPEYHAKVPLGDATSALSRSYARALLALITRDEAALMKYFSLPEEPKESVASVLRAEFGSGGSEVDAFYDRVFELVNKTFTGLQVESAQLETRNGAKLSLPYAKSLFNLAGRGMVCLFGLEVAMRLFPHDVFVGRELNFFRTCELAVYLMDRIPTYRKYFGEILKEGAGIVETYEVELVRILSNLCVICERDFDKVVCMLERFANFKPAAMAALRDAHKKCAPKEFVELCDAVKKRKNDNKEEGEKKKKEKKKKGGDDDDEEEEEKDVLKEALSQSSLDDGDLCEICYTNEKDTVFVPCGHSSCRLCIERQMTTDKTCFFCKMEITSLKNK